MKQEAKFTRSGSWILVRMHRLTLCSRSRLKPTEVVAGSVQAMDKLRVVHEL